MLKAVVPVLALVAVAVAVAVAAGCSSSEGKDEQRLTGLRENYCMQLGRWQNARNAMGTATPESPAYEEAGLVAQDALLAMRPLRDETVSGGRTLGEETMLAINNGDGYAEAQVVQYCDNVGFETLTR
ncbi:hypothetical protein AB0919_41170 [Streptomyces sp. NPDC046994]|uniref:hypothetical protein n=1 Tax=Streptomyces sp. NPDC046994 TaxID=3155735 RepID=UPI003456AC33